MGHIINQESTVYYSPTANRRFITRRAACWAEARSQMNIRHAYDIDDHWHWTHDEKFIQTHKRLFRLLLRGEA